jgi:hypothetical protein
MPPLPAPRKETEVPENPPIAINGLVDVMQPEH